MPTEPGPVTEDWRERAVEAAWQEIPQSNIPERMIVAHVLAAIESDLGPLAPVETTKRLIVERLQGAPPEIDKYADAALYVENLPIDDLGGGRWSSGVFILKLTASEPQGVPGEPPPGIWDGRKVAARDETHAVEVAERIFPGWTVLTVTEEDPNA